MSEPYALTAADVDGCRKILARLESFDATTGGYSVGNVQGHTRSATATVHYRRAAGALATAEAISYALDQVENLGSLCRKVIAHAETHGVQPDRRPGARDSE